MNRWVRTTSAVVVAAALFPPLLLARAELAQTSPPATPRIKACSLVPKEEVKKHLPWNAIVDSMQPEEQPIGAAGSSCNYPSVFVQVLPGVSKVPGRPGGTEYEPVSGVGVEAYFRNNRNRFAELWVKTATHTVTLQANADGKVEAVKPNVVNLAKVLIAKLR